MAFNWLYTNECAKYYTMTSWLHGRTLLVMVMLVGTRADLCSVTLHCRMLITL